MTTTWELHKSYLKTTEFATSVFVWVWPAARRIYILLAMAKLFFLTFFEWEVLNESGKKYADPTWSGL